MEPECPVNDHDFEKLSTIFKDRANTSFQEPARRRRMENELKTCCSVLGHEQHQVVFVVCTPSKVAGCLELFTSREQMVTDISEEAILAASRLEEENTHKNQRRACGIL